MCKIPDLPGRTQVPLRPTVTWSQIDNELCLKVFLKVIIYLEVFKN